MKFVGTWHITEMDMWDIDYINMETQAYVEVKQGGSGYFQFGLVSGQIDGEVEEFDKKERFVFTWEGNDECDPAFGSGWLILIDDAKMQGKIKFHLGDSSMFYAKRAD